MQTGMSRSLMISQFLWLCSFDTNFGHSGPVTAYFLFLVALPFDSAVMVAPEGHGAAFEILKHF